MALVHDCQIKAHETISEKEKKIFSIFKSFSKYQYFMSLEKKKNIEFFCVFGDLGEG